MLEALGVTYVSPRHNKYLQNYEDVKGGEYYTIASTDCDHARGEL